MWDPPGAADLRDEREMERLRPISSSVWTLQVPRQFAHMGKRASKQPKSASHQVKHVIFRRRASTKTGVRKRRQKRL